MSEPFARIDTPQQNASNQFEGPVDVKTAARFLGVSASLVYAYVERKQLPHYRMMGRLIRFRLSELAEWRQQFHVNGGINEETRKTASNDNDGTHTLEEPAGSCGGGTKGGYFAEQFEREDAEHAPRQ
jgi:excisionase family DNA binding protein